MEFVLSYGERTAEATRLLFQGLFESFLALRDLTVTRFPPMQCIRCGYRQERTEVIRRTLERRNSLFCSNCGFEIKLSSEGVDMKMSTEEHSKIHLEKVTAGIRTKFEAILLRLNSYVRKLAIEVPNCFISYAWGDSIDERWTETQLAPDLQKAGIKVLIDRWENSAIGSNVARFISCIDECKRIIVVGSPLYRNKYENKLPDTGTVVAAEVDLINKRLLGTEEQKKTVLPLVLRGDENNALPPLVQGKVYADFRREETYFPMILDLILSVYEIPFQSPAVADFRETIRKATSS